MHFGQKKSFKVSPQLLILYIMGLMMALAVALPAYVHSNFLNQFVGLRMVSFFFIVANALAFLMILVFPRIIKKLGNRTTFKAVLVLFALSLFSFSIVRSAWSGLVSIILFTIAFNLVFIKLDLFIEKFTKNKDTGKVRTIYLTFYNLGWVAAPSLSSYLIQASGYNFVYWLAGVLMIPAFIIFIFYSPQLKSTVKYKEVRLVKTIERMWHDKNLRGIFFVALILQLFYTTAVVYLPIYLHQTLGIGWQTLGPIFSIMLLPFVLFEFPAGYLADKYFGEKEMLAIGLLILTVALFLFFYIDITTAWIWAIVLFFSRTGAALVESMRESYFFKLVGPKDVGEINLFRLTGPLAYIIGPGIAILITSFFPINYLFFFIAFITLAGVGITLTLKDSR
jgi:MFS family permease